MSTLRIRQHAKRLAQTEGISVNQLVSSALAEKLSALDAERYLNERAKRGRRLNINAILANVPNTEPKPEDRIGSDAKIVELIQLSIHSKPAGSLARNSEKLVHTMQHKSAAGGDSLYRQVADKIES
jgi:hypothetical protein